MFGGAFDLDFADETTKIWVRRNGCDGAPKELRLPPNSKLADLFEKAAKVLDVDGAQRAYYANGMELTDVDNLEDDEVIFISCGEPFKGASVKSGAGSRQIIGNFIIHEKLGQGGFGSVMKGVHSETGEVAAIKFVSKASFKQISDLQRVYQEIQNLRTLQHPNVIKILDVADHPENVCFIMEFAPGGELRNYVERQGACSEEESRKFFREIARAIHYVHSKKIIHRDLKLENILLDGQNRCKIVDFGLSDYVSSKERTVTDAGTEAYLAPEVYNGSSGDADPYKIDVWGLGVILYALAHGKLPFNRPDLETCQKLVAEGGPQYREELSMGYRRLDTAMLLPSPEKRASMDAISLDPWVTKNRFANFCGGEDEEGGHLPGAGVPIRASSASSSNPGVAGADEAPLFGGGIAGEGPLDALAGIAGFPSAGAQLTPPGSSGGGGPGGDRSDRAERPDRGAGGAGRVERESAVTFGSEKEGDLGGAGGGGGGAEASRRDPASAAPSRSTSGVGGSYGASARPAAAAAAAIIGGRGVVPMRSERGGAGGGGAVGGGGGAGASGAGGSGGGGGGAGGGTIVTGRGARGAQGPGGGAADSRRRVPSTGPASPSPPRGPVAQAGATVAGTAGATRRSDRDPRNGTSGTEAGGPGAGAGCRSRRAGSSD